MFRFIAFPVEAFPFGALPENSFPEFFEGAGPTPTVTSKSAASKLGLGKYDSTDIWNTPFSVYVETLRGSSSKALSNEQKGTKFPIEEDTLKRITQEIEKAEKSLLAFATERKADLRREIEMRKRVARSVERRLLAEKRRRILEEDEILLLYI